MTKFSKKLLSVFASGAVLLTTVAPVFAGTTIEISGNGADSTNKAYVEMEQVTTVVQSNNADVFNKVDADADSGGNSAKGNTGGDVSIETGDATTDVKVENTLNSNTASVDCCGAGDVDVLISGNGADSYNKVDLDVNEDTKYTTGVFQSNNAEVKNKIYTDADTGDNKAKENTGGDVSIKTGAAESTVSISTVANANWATVGGSGGEGGTLSMRILGNGADSTNKIYLDLENVLALEQDNYADVYNKVDADAESGDNYAKENTGGEVSIETGDATTDIGIDNMVNFNWAEADCGGCLFDVLAKVSGNGADTYNKIKADFDDELIVFQGNCDPISAANLGKECELDNKVYTDADSGDNKIKENTGDPGSDPSIETGAAESTVDINNAGNSNVYGAEAPSDWPDFEFNFNVSLSWSQLLALLGLQS